MEMFKSCISIIILQILCVQAQTQGSTSIPSTSTEKSTTRISIATELPHTSTQHPLQNSSSPNPVTTNLIPLFQNSTTTGTPLPTTRITTQPSTTRLTTTPRTVSSSSTPSNAVSKFVSPNSRTGTDPVRKTARRMRDCGEILLAGYKTSGAYKIYPFDGSTKGIYVTCDMDTDGGGWTVLLSRSYKGVQRESFDLNSTSYTNGFGTTCGDSWIGLSAIAALTSRNDQQARWDDRVYHWIDHWNPNTGRWGWWYWELNTYTAYYRYFQIGDASENYEFRTSIFQGGNADRFAGVNGSEFFTKDRWSKNCTPAAYSGPGWYNKCTQKLNLNQPVQVNVEGGYGGMELRIRNPFLKWNTTLTEATKNFERFGRIPRDCMEVLLSRNTASGVYKIFPDQTTAFVYVYCDMTTDGGGWTTIMQRGKYAVEREDFSSYTWEEYVAGFGSTCGDLVMGMTTLHTLTGSQDQSLRIDLTDWESRTAYAKYEKFWIENSEEEFQLQVGGYSGNAGDSLSPHNGLGFSTPDRDNDLWEGNCAEEYGGGWWYANCVNSNLNGEYLNATQFSYGRGLIWSTWKGFNYSVKTVEMRIRNLNFPTLRDLYATV